MAIVIILNSAEWRWVQSKKTHREGYYEPRNTGSADNNLRKSLRQSNFWYYTDCSRIWADSFPSFVKKMYACLLAERELPRK